jgi:hypothetical protein
VIIALAPGWYLCFLNAEAENGLELIGLSCELDAVLASRDAIFAKARFKAHFERSVLGEESGTGVMI